MKRKPHFEVGQKIDDYILDKFISGGQDGEVWRVTKRSLGKVVAIKFLNSIKQEDKKNRFNREIQILASLNNPHIIHISDKGEAWNPKTKKLVPYYVMEYLDALPLNKLLKTISKREILKIFCSLFQQASSALVEIHNRGITHGDIKAANILVLPRYGILKLTDFGFGLLPGEARRERDVYPSSSYHTPDGYSPKEADIYKLGRTFEDCLTEVTPKLSSAEMRSINSVLKTLINNPASIPLETLASFLETIKEQPYKIADRYYEKIDTIVPEVSGGIGEIGVRDTIRGDISLTQRAIAIINLQEFQRLRKMREMVPCDIVYPSMSYTRFEAALGKYGEMMDYLTRLSNLSQFRETVNPLHLQTAVLLSLVNDIGQYPFSSQIYSATKSTTHDPKILSASMVSKDPISSIILKYWDVDPNLVAAILKGGHPNDYPKSWRLICTILDGSVSAPKVDSLARILAKTGFATTFDAQKLVNSLRIIPEHGIAVRYEDLYILEDFLLSNYLVLDRVIYHHIIKAANLMLVQAFRELNESGFDFKSLLIANEWEFIEESIRQAQLRDLPRAEQLLKLYAQTRIHKRVTTGYYDEIKSINFAHGDLILSTKLEKKFSKLLGKPFPPGSIIFDLQDPFYFHFEMPVVISPRKILLADKVSPLIANLLEKIRRDFYGRYSLFASKEVINYLKEIEHREFSKIISRIT